MNPFEPRPPPGPPPAAPGPPVAESAGPGSPFAPIQPAPGHSAPGYGVPGPEVPRLISAGLPPGYQAEEQGAEPAAILYLRLYCGLQAFCASVMGFYAGRSLLHELARSSHDDTAMGFLAAGLAVSMTIVGANMLGLLCPRQRWMHTAGTVIIGVSLLANSCCWLMGIPMLLTWLKPEVRKWFEGGSG